MKFTLKNWIKVFKPKQNKVTQNRKNLIKSTNQLLHLFNSNSKSRFKQTQTNSRLTNIIAEQSKELALQYDYLNKVRVQHGNQKIV